jgi:folliculin
MNAIISLCHFCELHGPSVLFCTQAFHSHEPSADQGQEDKGAEAKGPSDASTWNFAKDGLRIRSPSVRSVSSECPVSPSPSAQLAASFPKLSASEVCEVN